MSQYKEIIYFLFIIGTILHTFALLRCQLLKYNIDIDFLSINKKNNLILNGWALSHLLLYIYIGYIYPNNYFVIIIMSLLWEYYEYLFSKDKIFMTKLYISICGEKDGKMQMLHNTYDPFINLFGYFIGNLFVIYKN